jgi:hypothetical protein
MTRPSVILAYIQNMKIAMYNTVGVGVVQRPETKAYLVWIVLYGNRLAYVAAHKRFEAAVAAKDALRESARRGDPPQAVAALIACLEAEAAAEIGEVPAEVSQAIAQSLTEAHHPRN